MDDILNSTSEGIWIWDAFGRLIAVNKFAERIGGIRETALIGKSYIELIRSGLYDRSVAHDIFRSKRNAVTRAESLRTGVQTVNTGVPYLNDRGEIVRIVVRETVVDNEVSGQSIQVENMQRLQDGFEDPNVVRVGSLEVVARSSAYRTLLKRAFKLADAGVSRILILGESGTGKGLLAKLIHEKSPRREGPFVQLNCAAVPENLLESELFGYENGAFTGARAQGKEGLFEAADGGTLFLDEVGTLPLSLQAKLLKYLDDFQVTRLGGTRVKRVDCSVLAATNVDLTELVKRGEFREDLYYRINGFTVTIPSLKERTEDIPALLSHYIEKYNRKFKLCRYPSGQLVNQLRSYPFPGNVRELKNICRQVVVLSEADLMDDSVGPLKIDAPLEPSTDLKTRMMDYEKELLMEAISMHHTTRDVGRYLGIDQSSVVRKMKKYGISMKEHGAGRRCRA